MCGIAGLFNYRGSVPADHRLSSMLRAMHHRGPDGQGRHSFVGGAMGMVRLAMVDLTAAGDQPIWSMCGRLAIIFNGEIYNFRELRAMLAARGHKFRTTTDTEVVLALYQEFGLKFVERLRGMFAIAIFDWRKAGSEAAPELILARSPCGIKPLYIAELRHDAEATVVFASELKGMLASGLIDRRISHAALNDFLRLGAVLQPHTMLEGVRMATPGTLEHFATGRPTEVHRFWNLPPYEPRVESFRESAERLRATLNESVRLHAFADAPVGVFLSGGIDSTAIASLMRSHVAELNAYTLRFPDLQVGDEIDTAAETAKRLDCRHHIVDVTGRDALAALPAFARGIDQPSVDGLNAWFVSRAASRDVKGVLSGLGADEWFGGYSVTQRMLRSGQSASGRLRALLGRVAHVLNAPFADTRVRRKLDTAASHRSLLALWCHPHSVFSPDESDILLGVTHEVPSWERLENELIEQIRCAVGTTWHDETPIGMSCMLDAYAFMMCQLLRDADAVSMSWSLELRVPFVDVEMIRFSRSCRDEYKVGRGDATVGNSKMVLVEALGDVLPSAIRRRPKRGFNVPIEHWMRRELAPVVEEACGVDVVRRRGWFDPQAVQALRFPGGNPSQRTPYPRLWSLTLAELWAREVFDAPAASGDDQRNAGDIRSDVSVPESRASAAPSPSAIANAFTDDSSVGLATKATSPLETN